MLIFEEKKSCESKIMHVCIVKALKVVRLHIVKIYCKTKNYHILFLLKYKLTSFNNSINIKNCYSWQKYLRINKI